MFQQLAHIGAGNLILIDPDHAEDTNINRMVTLTHNDAVNKLAKTAVAERYVEAINPNASVTVRDKPWQMEPQLLKDCTAIFGCVDSVVARDELERFARRYSIPYIDVGMDVHGEEGRYFMTGQVVTSLPGRPCMRCMGFITEEMLAAEQKRYGAAGGRPQVVWPNGVLASTAVGNFMALLTPWNTDLQPCLYLEYDGNRSTVQPSNRLLFLDGFSCTHFVGTEGVGDLVL